MVVLLGIWFVNAQVAIRANAIKICWKIRVIRLNLQNKFFFHLTNLCLHSSLIYVLNVYTYWEEMCAHLELMTVKMNHFHITIYLYIYSYGGNDANAIIYIHLAISDSL